jgi:hypothetical protein
MSLAHRCIEENLTIEQLQLYTELRFHGPNPYYLSIELHLRPTLRTRDTNALGLQARVPMYNRDRTTDLVPQ